MTIFVSIAAYLEPQLEFTLDEVFCKAEQPKNVIVGLIDQSKLDNRSWLSKKSYWSQIRYIQINPIDSRGVSWARSLASTLYEGEDYFLQIDSHTCFSTHWDTLLIQQLAELLRQSSHPIITTYPPGFEFDEQNKPRPTYHSSHCVLVMRPVPHSKLTETSATLMFQVEAVHEAEFIEGFHVGGGFIFTLGRFVEAVPYDPYMYFHGEEQNLALRAYTHGWTIFHPLDDKIPIFHLYKPAAEESVNLHWDPSTDSERQIKWIEHHRRSEARLISLIRGEIAAPYGLGTSRTLEEFVAFSKIDYGRYRL